MKKYAVLFIFVGMLVFFSYRSNRNTIANQIPYYPNDWFYMQRAYPIGEVNYPVYLEALKEARIIRTENRSKNDSSVWEFAGPLNIGGRLSDVEMHPSDMSTIYSGAASGGVFKSTDAGDNWEAVFDEALSLSIGDIAVAPSDPLVIYVGTGEANAGGGSQTYDGVGIYKSADGGDTWTHCGLEMSRNIGRMAVHPQNPDIVYVAAMGNLFSNNPDRGIYKTTDGGLNWQNVLFISDSTGAIDVVLNPTDPDVVYAAMWERVRRPDRRSYGGLTCGIYKSSDGGQNWTELTSGLPSPGSNVGRIGIDISQSDPDILYAIYADKTGYFFGVYKSVNGGNTWNQTNDGSLSDCFASYGWWFGRISIDPTDPQTAYVIGFDLYKTTNGGNSWNYTSSNVHVDQHAVYAHPQNPDFVVVGNDGGLYISENGGQSWSWKNNLPITQFYTCEIDQQHPQRLYGGTQDNGTNRTLTGNTDDWQSIYWGDGFYVLVDPTDNDYVYAEYQYGNFAKSTDGGYSFYTAMNGISGSDRMNWCTPVVFDPTNPEILYYGSQRLYKSTNRAGSWSVISDDLTNGPGVNLTYGTITSISVSPINPDVIYVGTDDGNVWVSAMNGSGWEYLSLTLPDRWVTRVAADPWDENTAYVTFSGYRWDEYLPHIFRTNDKGENWEDISGDLPEVPVNDVIIDPEITDHLYIATDVGVFSTQNSGISWKMMGSNLPNVPVNDLTLHNDSRTLVAATFGRSMYTYDLNQDTLGTYIEKPRAFDKSVQVSVYPNPFTSEVTIKIANQMNQQGTVEIFDPNGRKIETIRVDVKNSGENQITWRPDQGVLRSNGYLMVVVKVDKKVFSEKILYLGD